METFHRLGSLFCIMDFMDVRQVVSSDVHTTDSDLVSAGQQNPRVVSLK